MRKSDQIGDLIKAMVKVQAGLRGAKKDSKNPFFNSSYADLESVWDACRSLLADNGLAVIQACGSVEGKPHLFTTLAHSSGQWIEGAVPLMPAKPDMQGLGGAITYARRYGLAAAVGIIQTDDDGETAVGRGKGFVHPEQPSAGDGAPEINPGYRIPFGKFKGRSLEDVGPRDLRSYVDYLERSAAKQNKQVAGEALDFIEQACAYIAAFEASPIEVGAEG